MLKDIKTCSNPNCIGFGLAMLATMGMECPESNDGYSIITYVWTCPNCQEPITRISNDR